MKKYSVFLFFLYLSNLHAFAWKNLTTHQRILLSPEVSYVQRSREGGTKQTGLMYGIHLNYDRIKPGGIYWGFDGYYSLGNLSGKSGSGNSLSSDFRDAEAEGKLGWSFCLQIKKPILVTPYISYGYIYNKNDFDNIKITFEDEVQYYGGGVLLNVYWTPKVTVGILVGNKVMFEGTSTLLEAPDPDDQGAKLMIENKSFYTIEIPISYQFCKYGRYLQALVTPFYRFRHFGSRENFPQDFIDTKYRFYGVRAALCYRF